MTKAQLLSGRAYDILAQKTIFYRNFEMEA